MRSRLLRLSLHALSGLIVLAILLVGDDRYAWVGEMDRTLAAGSIVDEARDGAVFMGLGASFVLVIETALLLTAGISWHRLLPGIFVAVGLVLLARASA